MDRYNEYFNMQVGGSGSGGISRVYIGSPYQRGHGGIGSFLAGVFRRVLPLLSRGAKAVGKEALRTGLNIMTDVTTQDTPIRESFRTRVREGGESLKRKAEEKLDRLMEGSGYKVPRHVGMLQLLGASQTTSKKTIQSKRKRKTGHTKKKRKVSSVKRGRINKKPKKKKKNKVQRSQKKRSTRDIFE